MAAGCAREGEKGKKLWRFLRNANTGAFRLECHHGLERTAKYFFVPNICVLQPNVFSLGAVHPGKGQAHAMTMSCELCFNELCCWLTLDVQHSHVPTLCLDHPLALELLGGTGHSLGQENAGAVSCLPTDGCCNLDHPCQRCPATSGNCTGRNLLPRALSCCSGQNDF